MLDQIASLVSVDSGHSYGSIDLANSYLCGLVGVHCPNRPSSTQPFLHSASTNPANPRRLGACRLDLRLSKLEEASLNPECYQRQIDQNIPTTVVRTIQNASRVPKIDGKRGVP